MRHLVNYSVYQQSGVQPSLHPGDGLELLTGYFEAYPKDFPDTVSVHLPYVVDWYSVWSGRYRIPDDYPDDHVPFFSYGRDRDSIIVAVRKCIECAAPFDPAYGIIHAGSANIKELFSERYSDTDHEVLKAFAEIVNQAVSSFPGGEPPFRLMFENQWWPGLRMLDGKNYETLRDLIEFDNWGLCLDTGHLLVTTQESKDELQAIDLLTDIFSGYPKEMIDAIGVIHLHVNTSAGYIKGYKAPEGIYDKSLSEILNVGYSFVPGMDQHRPFTTTGVKRITDILRPDFVTHEMGASDVSQREKDYLLQRSLFC